MACDWRHPFNLSRGAGADLHTDSSVFMPTVTKEGQNNKQIALWLQRMQTS